MLFNLFSKNSDEEDSLGYQRKKLLDSFLNNYRSDAFPHGIFVIAQAVSILESKKNIIINAVLPFPCDGELKNIAEKLTELVQFPIHFNVEYRVNTVRKHEVNGVKNIIAISSAKGGVGKSTTAVNLAYALIAEGCSVGILDADIYGPSIPTMLGLKGKKPKTTDGELMIPLEKDTLLAMSIGFLVDEQEATVWRGPMASRAFTQLFNETDWQGVDYLLIDMPPGTGDIQLTLAQQLPVAGAVVITTPQDIAAIDAQKGIAMFDSVKVPVLGIIENMSFHQCPECGHREHIFSSGGGQQIAEKTQTTFLGQLPLDQRIQQAVDQGNSIINENSARELTELYRNIARKMAAQIFYQLDMSSPDAAQVVRR